MIYKIKLALYQIKQWLRSIYIYPKFNFQGQDYDKYWQSRNLDSITALNEFQKKRVEFTLSYIEKDSVFMDFGSGSGSVLAYINKEKPMKELIGVDISEYALNLAKEKGIKTFKKDLTNIENLRELPAADYISLFEVLEHVPSSEDLLRWAVERAQKGVFFSVPNTGFFTHRLRLLFGKFPLQWRRNPSEHLRFWTVRDMKWLMLQLGYNSYKLHLYKGVPLFRSLLPSLFAEGIFIYVPCGKSLPKS
ncbi:MAG: class I SAM-dependent methyltransferase [Candidatus Nealsonbacteria bacterium]